MFTRTKKIIKQECGEKSEEVSSCLHLLSSLLHCPFCFPCCLWLSQGEDAPAGWCSQGLQAELCGAPHAWLLHVMLECLLRLSCNLADVLLLAS